MFHLVRQTMIWIKVGEVISRGLHLLSCGVIKDCASSLFRVIKSQDPSPRQPPLLWLFCHAPASRLRLGLFLPLSLLRFHLLIFSLRKAQKQKSIYSSELIRSSIEEIRNPKRLDVCWGMRLTHVVRGPLAQHDTKLVLLNTSMCLRLVLNPQGIRL